MSEEAKARGEQLREIVESDFIFCVFDPFKFSEIETFCEKFAPLLKTDSAEIARKIVFVLNKADSGEDFWAVHYGFTIN